MNDPVLSSARSIPDRIREYNAYANRIWGAVDTSVKRPELVGVSPQHLNRLGFSLLASKLPSAGSKFGLPPQSDLKASANHAFFESIRDNLLELTAGLRRPVPRFAHGLPNGQGSVEKITPVANSQGAGGRSTNSEEYYSPNPQELQEENRKSDLIEDSVLPTHSQSSHQSSAEGKVDDQSPSAGALLKTIIYLTKRGALINASYPNGIQPLLAPLQQPFEHEVNPYACSKFYDGFAINADRPVMIPV